MNKTRFRLLVFFMSLSLIGIILVQLYWINSSLKSNDEQFRYIVQEKLNKSAGTLQDEERYHFVRLYDHIKDSVSRIPVRADFRKYLYKGVNDNEENAIYSDELSENFDDEVEFLEGDSLNKNLDPLPENSGESGMTIDDYKDSLRKAREDIEDKENLQFLYLFDYYNEGRPIENRITSKHFEEVLRKNLREGGVDIPFEFAIYTGGLATKIGSKSFNYDNSHTYGAPVFIDREGKSKYRMWVSFPEKGTFILNRLLGITVLSVIFTLIIIIAYLSAINQLIKQKQISEIKTDFINNMTHEFKTPIATINLALDAIKNPKIFSEPEKVQRYLQMIREENKRMHSQVENVLQISKLDKKELDIPKEQNDIHNIIEDAIEHVHLIIEARNGTLTRHFHAQRTTALLNDVHFTNVLVNILDNAIKYSEDEPIIDIFTENVKDFILIKIADRGQGMSKTTQKRIFEKFFREHTGDIHNVKGHGLGLAYVKRIIDDHNCHIYVESEKGKGSTFIIKMPLIN